MMLGEDNECNPAQKLLDEQRTAAAQQHASLLDGLSDKKKKAAMKKMATSELAGALSQMSPEDRAATLGLMSEEERLEFERDVMSVMSPAEKRSAMAALPQTERAKILNQLSPEERKEVLQFVSNDDKAAARVLQGEDAEIAGLNRTQLRDRLLDTITALEAAVFVKCAHCGKDLSDRTEQEKAASLIQKNFRVKYSRPDTVSRVDCKGGKKFEGKTIEWMHKQTSKLFADKVVADDVDDRKHNVRQTMIEFLTEWSMMNFGPNHEKVLETFLATLFRYESKSADLRMLLNFVEEPAHNMLHVQNVFLRVLVIQGDHKRRRGAQHTIEASWGVIAQTALGELDSTLQQRLYLHLEEVWAQSGSLVNSEQMRQIPSATFRSAITAFHRQIEVDFGSMVHAVFNSIMKAHQDRMSAEEFNEFVAFFDGLSDPGAKWDVALAHTHRIEDDNTSTTVSWQGLVAMCESIAGLLKGSPIKDLFRLNHGSMIEHAQVKTLLSAEGSEQYTNAATLAQQSVLQPQTQELCDVLSQQVANAKVNQAQKPASPK